MTPTPAIDSYKGSDHQLQNKLSKVRLASIQAGSNNNVTLLSLLRRPPLPRTYSMHHDGCCGYYYKAKTDLVGGWWHCLFLAARTPDRKESIVQIYTPGAR